jgi:hypothetical protein
MGQELFDVNTYYEKKPRKYYVATNSKGFKVARSTESKNYSHAVVLKTPEKWGAIYYTFTSRLDLANRYCKSWNINSVKSNSDREYEVVEAKEVSAKEFRVVKQEIKLQHLKAEQAEIKTITNVYQVNTDSYVDEEEKQLWDTEVVSATKN